jgi:hypothetical protein
VCLPIKLLHISSLTYYAKLDCYSLKRKYEKKKIVKNTSGKESKERKTTRRRRQPPRQPNTLDRYATIQNSLKPKVGEIEFFLTVYLLNKFPK